MLISSTSHAYLAIHLHPVEDGAFLPILLVKGKVAVPVSDKEAHLVYFITARSSRLSVMNLLARQFHNAFNGRYVYAV